MTLTLVLVAQLPLGSQKETTWSTALLPSCVITLQKKLVQLQNLARFWLWQSFQRLEAEKSCDIYFYEVARLLGVDRLAETIRKFNFGQTTLKDFDEEKKGLVPDTKWKKNALGKPWLLGETQRGAPETFNSMGISVSTVRKLHTERLIHLYVYPFSLDHKRN